MVGGEPEVTAAHSHVGGSEQCRHDPCVTRQCPGGTQMPGRRLDRRRPGSLQRIGDGQVHPLPDNSSHIHHGRFGEQRVGNGIDNVSGCGVLDHHAGCDQPT
jgi:hypothetical protein